MVKKIKRVSDLNNHLFNFLSRAYMARLPLHANAPYPSMVNLKDHFILFLLFAPLARRRGALGCLLPLETNAAPSLNPVFLVTLPLSRTLCRNSHLCASAFVAFRSSLSHRVSKALERST
jgi:hypothetical protein